MNPIELNDLEVAPLEVVYQAACYFAAALAAMAQYHAFETAGEKLQHDPAAQEAIQAYKTSRPRSK